MTTDYLPAHATCLEACEWLRAKTGKTWTLARLLESGLMPWFWLDYTPGWPALFGGRVEGYLAPMVFAGDMQRLEADGTVALVNMTRTHDDVLMPLKPGMKVLITDLRFKRDDLQDLGKAFQNTAPAQTATPAPAPVGTVGASMIHSTKARRNALTPVIEFAQRQCSNPEDDAEVWAAFLVLAEKKHAPLIGCTEAGLQYLKNGDVGYFNRGALRKRLDR